MPRGRKRNEVHPGQQCGPCHLCHQSSTHYSHLITWGDALKLKLRELTLTTDDDCICRKCEKDIKRNIENIHSSTYQPRWLSHVACSQEVQTAKCAIPGCTSTKSFIQTSKFSQDRVSQILGIEMLPSTPISPITLCERHYKTVYELAHIGRERNGHKCYACHSTTRAERHCPDTNAINTYFQENGDIDLGISESDYLCTACYNTHLDIVHQNERISRDHELQKLMDLMSEHLPALELEQHHQSILEGVKKVIRKLGEILQQKLGILYPELHNFFITTTIQFIQDSTSNTLTANQISDILPRKILFGYITSFFGKHLVWECKQKSCGILMYRRGADLALTLSKTLKCLQASSSSPLYEKEADEGKLEQFCAEMNKRIHKQISTITSHDSKEPCNIAHFNMQEWIDSLDPVLWNMIFLLTRNVTEKRKDVRPESMSHHRKFQCLYSLCVLLFNTNRRCSIPLHLLLTDLVEAQGGSSELISMLNRVGAIASADTHQRYAQFIVERKLEAGLLSELSKDMFTVVSVDNIDFLQRHAFVYCGDQQRSWHGTTIQVVQPMCNDQESAGVETTDSPLPEVHCTTDDSPSTNMCTGPTTHPLQESHPQLPSRISLEKRTTHPTPDTSPTTRSPVFKKVARRSRTSTEVNSTHYHIPTSPPIVTDFTSKAFPLQQMSDNHYSVMKTSHTINSFKITSDEDAALEKFHAASFFYAIASARSSVEELTYLGFVEELFPVSTSPSKYAYLNVLDQNADSKETIGDVLCRLHTEFRIGDKLEHLVMVGDAKTYNHLQTLKLDYGNELSWLQPFPGDFHILLNFQPVISKIYFDAGLKQIAAASGHRGETLTSLQKCSHFKKTHHFILQAWEGLYVHMVQVFLAANPEVTRAVDELLEQTKSTGIESAFQSSMKKLLKFKKDFDSFASSMAEEDPNWRFWHEFVSLNGFSYVAFFASVRSANWNLRIGSLKLMAPIFRAFDRPTYGKLVPQHLADCLLLPAEIQCKFALGGFTVSVTGRSWHSVGLDEAHEMLINKDCKMAVVHPNKEFVSRMAAYFPFRSEVIHNFQSQLGICREAPDDPVRKKTMSSEERKIKENIEAIKYAIKMSELLPSYPAKKGLSLRNSFKSVNATTVQQNDLLNFRNIGQTDLNKHLQRVYLGVKDKVKTLTKQHRLSTFSTVKPNNRQYNLLQKEKNLITSCLKTRLLHCSNLNVKPTIEQYLELPRALADQNGIPHKGQKSSTTAFYSSKYGEEVIRTSFPNGWVPDSVILEGMFMINSTPLRIHSCMVEYAQYLLHRHVSRYISAGVKEVHIVFDDPGRLSNHPKEIERARRDSNVTACDDHHTFSDIMKIIPSKWSNMLGCRTCKRRLTTYLGDCLLRLAPQLLHDTQKMVISGVYSDEDQDQAWSTTATAIEVQEECYTSNSEEADTRVWLHLKHSKGTKKLIFSPDTDVYHIGLTNADCNSSDIMVMLSAVGRELKLLHLNKFIEVLESDLDLQTAPKPTIREIIQVMYVLTGCDFTSFFYGVSKQVFLKVLFTYFTFISVPCRTIPGSLADVDPDGDGFLAFVRLVGAAYFTKNKRAFPYHSPVSHFDSFHKSNESDIKDQHSQWYQGIREAIWERVCFEDHLPPSLDALKLHWLRCIWVIDYWRQACQGVIRPLPVEHCGWKVDSSGIQVEWDSPQNLQKVRNSVAFLLKGCGCKTGCVTARCRCVKAGQPCGPGCKCSDGITCTNQAIGDDQENNRAAAEQCDSDSIEQCDSDSIESDEEMIADEIETNSTSEMDISEEEDLVLTAFLGGYQLLGDMTMTASTS